ncbi:hypothetical protein SO3561_10636 [Streptomyces olivochromogenes]|uniref:Uncharacterized protein n=1 Tax=Streptomyces olivochromogenes TaxID=1963 RepID=A0A286TT01_STROL|nr:hypothetical protein SO3561_10636 [Streptomyces olivochromogenes]
MTGTSPASGDVLEPVRQHFRDPANEIDVGPGWRQLVLECHEAVVAEFPEYEHRAIKQKLGSLAFQALPRPWKPGGNWTHPEYARLHAVTDAFADRSEGICERCGADGSLREGRRILLVLCDQCETLVPGHGRL